MHRPDARSISNTDAPQRKLMLFTGIPCGKYEAFFNFRESFIRSTSSCFYGCRNSQAMLEWRDNSAL